MLIDRLDNVSIGAITNIGKNPFITDIDLGYIPVVIQYIFSAGFVFWKIFCHSSSLKSCVINLAFDFYTKQIYPVYLQFKDVR